MFSIHKKHKTTTLLQNSWLNARRDTSTTAKPLTIAVESAISGTKSKLKKNNNSIITFIAAYFKSSNIHGMQYLVSGNLTKMEKFLWLTLLIISMYFCVEIGLQSVDHYYTKSTVVGLERDFYYWNTSLPSATICPLMRLNAELFNEYCRQHSLSTAEQREFFVFMEKLANATYVNFFDIPDSKSIDLILDRLNIKPDKYMQLIYNLTGDPSIKYKTDLNMLDGKVRSTTTGFTIESRQVLTEYGLCYMTNTMLSEKYTSLFMIWGKYPANELKGLSTILQVKQSSYFDNDVSYTFFGFNESAIDGFLHSPYEVMRLDHNLGYSSDSMQVEVECTEIIAAENFESEASIEQRHCRFQHESNLTHFPIYTRTTCQQECRLNLVYKMCKCIPHFYPNRIKNPKTVCNYKILRECFAQNEHYFIKLYKVDINGKKLTVPCYCEQNCQDSIVNKRSEVHLEKAADLMGGNSIILSVTSSPTYRLKRLIIFTFTDLLVSIGGTAGLFLGFSVLCLVEVIYYFTLRLLFFLIKRSFQRN